MKHKHHVVPRYEGGSDDSSNIVELTVTQHAMWHYAEWRRKGNWQDKLAWKGLAKILGKEEIVYEATLRGARSPKPGRGPMTKGNDKRRETMLGKTKTPEMKANSSLAAKRRWAKEGAKDHFSKNEEVWKTRLDGRDFSDRRACSLIAQEYGVTYHCVRNWAVRLGLKSSRG